MRVAELCDVQEILIKTTQQCFAYGYHGPFSWKLTRCFSCYHYNQVLFMAILGDIHGKNHEFSLISVNNLVENLVEKLVNMAINS